jgi:hypothetical protein
MGAGQSTPSVLTHDKLYELTKDTRGVMNVLLDYMLKEVTVRDFLLLSNPQECKKYVLFMANNLYKYFYELKILPTKDKRGIIAFRPVKELTSLPEDVDREKQSLCLVLAYFYTRIFQIYGALALTLIDDASYMSESGLLSLGESGERGLLPPGYRQFTTFGGAPTLSSTSFGDFTFLKSYLKDEYDTSDISKGFLTKYMGEGPSQGVIYFNQRGYLSSSGKSAESSEIKTQAGVFAIGYRGAKKYAYLDVLARKEEIGSQNIIFEFRGLRYYPARTSKEGGSETVYLGADVIPKKVIKIDAIFEGDRVLYSIRDSEDSGSVNEYFNNIFLKVVPFVKKLYEGTATTGPSPSAVALSEVGTAEELRMARIIQNLTKTKPLGHCIARAIQLLRNLPLKGEPGVSYICKAKFFESSVTSGSGDKTTITRSGIPEPGTTLDHSPGLAALSQLFYDTVVIGSPKLVMSSKPGPAGQPSTLQQYILFMKNLARLFGDEKDDSGITKSDDSIRLGGLKGLKNLRDKELCGKYTGDITVPSTVVGSVYDIVNQMFKDQLAHSAQCGAIFKELFNLVRDKASGRFLISLNDNIIKNGLPEIERINFKARQLLVNYYTNCETKYLKGMKIVLDTQQRIEAKTSIYTRPRPIPVGKETGKPSAAPTAPAGKPSAPLAAPGARRVAFA